jgi:hypothetical protein
MTGLAKAAGLSSGPDELRRLSALGLWDVYENSFSTGTSAVAINPLVRLLAGALNEYEEIALAGVVANDLFNSWGGPEGVSQRNLMHDFELTRLALLARQGEVLVHTAQYAVRWLEAQFAYPEAAAIGGAIGGAASDSRASCATSPTPPRTSPRKRSRASDGGASNAFLFLACIGDSRFFASQSRTQSR